MKLVKDIYFPEADQHMINEYVAGKTQLDLLDFAMDHVRNFSSVIDGGAHVGIWSLALAEKFKTVHAFEPCRDTFQCLSLNTNNANNVKTYNLALSEEFSTFDTVMDARWEGNTGGRYLVKGSTITAIPLNVLDLYDVGLVKLDVEGHELYALKGAKDLLTRCRPVVICEEKPRIMERQGVGKDDVFNYMVHLGYRRIKQIRRDSIYVKD